MNIAIYMEGGGRGRDSKAKMRQGMDIFLAEIKDAFRERNWHWRLVCCGSRNETYERFQNEFLNGDTKIVVLLVDSETQVNRLPSDHLSMNDGWNFQGVDNDMVHLMVEAMETWIVADPETLKEYYGKGFRKNVLPSRENLEKISKNEIAQVLDRATQGTQKGKYHKIHHGKDLLERMNPTTVRQRCPHCKRLFKTLLHMVRQTD